MADGTVEYDIRANSEYLEQDLNESKDIAEKGGKSLEEIAGKAAKAIGKAFAAAGIAEGVKEITSLATDMEKAVNGFSASTGIAIENTENYEQVMKNIYANNYGDDFQDIADSIALVNKNLGDMSDEELQTVTESAFALRDVFEYDVSETTRAAKAMMDNFGLSGEDAMSLIAAGAQNGLDYSGELIDSISEYSVQFAKMGLSADDMFNIFQAGADSGAWNLDKVGDAVKEMSIRVIDGSKTTQEGFAAIGLNADEMAYKFAAGGDTARQAFQQTLQALSNMEDPIAQDAAGVALLGTMWEDLGKDAVASLAGITGEAYDTGNAMEGIKEVKYNDLDSMLEGLKRNFELVALPIGEILIPQLKQTIETLVPLIQEYGPKIVDVIGRIISYGIELKNAVLDKIISVFGKLKEPLIEFIQNLIPKLADLFKETGLRISELISGIIPSLIDAASNLWDIFSEAVREILPKLAEAFKNIAGPVMKLVSEVFPILFDIFSRLYDAFFEAAKTVIPALINAFIIVSKAVLPIITELLPKLLELAVNLIDPLLSLIEMILPSLAECFSSVAEIVSEIIVAVIPILIDLFNTLIPIIKDIVSNVLPVLVEWFFAVADAVLGIIEAVLPVLIDLLNTLIPVILDIVSNVLPALTEVFTSLKEPITDLINSILPLLQEILEDVIKPAIDDLVPVIKILAEMFSDILKKAIEDVTPIISGVADVLKNVIKFITNVFQGDWESAWQNIKEAVLEAFNLIVSGIESGINGAVWLINEMINGINSISSEVGISAIPNIAEVSLPRFHTGGIIDFKGKYEAPILAKDGEMILTDAQQKMLFDMANGFYAPPANVPEAAYHENIVQTGTPETAEFVFIVDGKKMAEITCPYMDIQNGTRLTLAGRGVTLK